MLPAIAWTATRSWAPCQADDLERRLAHVIQFRPRACAQVEQDDDVERCLLRVGHANVLLDTVLLDGEVLPCQARQRPAAGIADGHAHADHADVGNKGRSALRRNRCRLVRCSRTAGPRRRHSTAPLSALLEREQPVNDCPPPEVRLHRPVVGDRPVA